MTTVLSLRCPAKLNLQLRVVGRRADGYHLLSTLFQAIDLADSLHAAPTAAAFELEIVADDALDLVPAGGDNLVLRAARAFAAAAAWRGGFRFHLHKRIPHGGGLGGGSSDAAAALRLCNGLAGEPLGNEALAAIARTLGADVPFFLRGGAQWGHGVGDELESCTTPARHFTLLAPPFGCPTIEVYKNFSAHWNAPFDAASIRVVRDAHHNDFASGEFVNDLAAAAERVRPELAQLRRRAEALGVAVAMTGSGSTLFAAAETAALAARDRQRLQPLAEVGVRILAARSLMERAEPESADWPGGGA